MLTALIVHSDYSRVSGFPALASCAANAQWFSKRLARPDAGFEVHRLSPDAHVVKHLKAFAKTRGGPDTTVLFAFFGYLALTENGEPALLLDERNVASLPLSRLKKFLARFSSSQLVLDVVLGTAVPGVDMSEAPRVVSDRLVLDLAQSNIAALVAVRPWGAPDSVAATPFTALTMNTLDELAASAELPVTTGSLYAAMCANPVAVGQVSGIGCSTSDPEFQFLRKDVPVRSSPPRIEERVPHALRMSVHPAAAPPRHAPAPLVPPTAPGPAVQSTYRAALPNLGAATSEAPTPARLPPLAEAPGGPRVASAPSYGEEPEFIEATLEPDEPEEHELPPPRAPQPTAEDLRAEREVLRMVQLGDEHAARGDYFAAQHEYQRGLEVAFTPLQRARTLTKLASVQRALGNDEQALEHLSEAVGADPAAEDAFNDLADLLSVKLPEEADAFYVSLRARMPSAAARSAVQRAAYRFWKDVARDDERALEALERLMVDAPSEHPRMKEDLARLAAQRGGAAEHAQMLHRIAEAQTRPESRADWLLAAAAVTKNELGDVDGAASLAAAALELSPSSIGALEFVSAPLVRDQSWEALAGVYERILERELPGEAAAKIAVGLAKICTGKLRDKRRAANAYEVAIQSHPRDVRLRHDVAALYESLGQLDRAGVHYREAVRAEPTNPTALHRAYAYFSWVKDVDAAWNAASALVHLGDASEEQARLAGTYRSDSLLAPRRSLLDDDWSGVLFGNRDTRVAKLFDIVGDAGLGMRVPKPRRERQIVEKYTEMDPEANTTTLARTLLWTSRLFGQPAPKLLLTDEESVGVQPAPVGFPAALASKSLGRGFSLPQLSFLWGRTLAMFRPEHYLFVFYPERRDVLDLINGVLIGADVVPPNGAESSTKKVARSLRRELKRSSMDEVRSTVNGLSAADVATKAEHFAREVELACLRAGLVACGNLALALELSERFPLTGELSASEQVEELIRFALSEPYARVRQALGVAVS